jgi:hypothetical protein
LPQGFDAHEPAVVACDRFTQAFPAPQFTPPQLPVPGLLFVPVHVSPAAHGLDAHPPAPTVWSIETQE